MKFEQLNLDAQKKYNLIIKELNTLSSKHDPESLQRKQVLAQQYADLMGHSMGGTIPTKEQQEQLKQAEAEKHPWRKQWSKREATHPK